MNGAALAAGETSHGSLAGTKTTKITKTTNTDWFVFAIFVSSAIFVCGA